MVRTTLGPGGCVHKGQTAGTRGDRPRDPGLAGREGGTRQSARSRSKKVYFELLVPLATHQNSSLVPAYSNAP